MKNEVLQNILKHYPNECDIVIFGNDYKEPIRVAVEYDHNDDFEVSRIIIEI